MDRHVAPRPAIDAEASREAPAARLARAGRACVLAKRTTIRHLTGTALAVLGLGALKPVRSQETVRPIKFILPGTPGSGVSTTTRAAAPALSRALGAPVVVEDQPGAGGIIGTTALVRSPPDGYTLSMVTNNHVIFPSIYKSLPFDPLADITPIAVVGRTPVVLVVNPERLPAKNAQELIRLLKAKPGRYNYGSSGNGTILHLAGAMFLEEAKTNAVHIPYKGTGPMLVDLIGGQLDFATATLPSVQQYLNAGSLRAIGVAARSRLAAAPEIPTMVEQGMPGYLIDVWFAVVGPAKLPQGDVKRIQSAFVTAFATPEVQEVMAKQGNTIDISTPEHAIQFFASEKVKMDKLAKIASLEVQ